jgi:phosphotransferase system enzyme I (PtsI)
MGAAWCLGERRSARGPTPRRTPRREGIGLFRTELLALAHRGAPPEDEQEILYERVAHAMAPRPVTIRTLDLGGDKAVPNLGLEAEENPQLGCRSVRLTMRHEELMRAQLRAILRASAVGNVRLLLPMISSLDELREVKRLLAATQDELARRGFAYDEEIPVGIMIEVPSAALIADALARRSAISSASAPTTSPSTRWRWTAATRRSRTCSARCIQRCWR